MSEQERPAWVSNVQLQLEIKALRADVKLWILAAVALNQFLAAADIPSSVTGAAVVGIVLKSLVGVVFRGGG